MFPVTVTYFQERTNKFEKSSFLFLAQWPSSCALWPLQKFDSCSWPERCFPRGQGCQLNQERATRWLCSYAPFARCCHQLCRHSRLQWSTFSVMLPYDLQMVLRREAASWLWHRSSSALYVQPHCCVPTFRSQRQHWQGIALVRISSSKEWWQKVGWLPYADYFASWHWEG